MKALPATLFALAVAGSALFVAWEVYQVKVMLCTYELRHTGELPWPCEPYELLDPTP